MRIQNKKQMYELLESGAFGNHLAVWRTEDELISCGRDVVGIRSIGIPGLPCISNPGLIPEVAWEEGERIKREYGCEVIFSELSPDQVLVLQGELLFSPGGPWVEYSTVQEPMRPALIKERIRVGGLEATRLLQREMSGASWEDTLVLAELYPDAVIEFGIYSVCLGVLTGRNTIIWEVRHY